MITRRGMLAATAGLALGAPPGRSFALPLSDSLRARAATRGLLYGAAVANYELADPAFATLFAREAAILVPEYELKRNLVEPSEGRLDFSAADALVGFARRNGLAMRGHPLVWYWSNPPWLEERVLATRDEKLLTGYVDSVARRYRGRMHSWDVVNEAVLPRDGRADGMRNSFWLEAFGPAYVDLAFHAARAADPQALLIYNDYGFEGAEAPCDAMRAATLKFLDGLIRRGVPVDGLGVQGHLSAFGPKLDQRKLRAFLDEVTARGLRILITEHDVDDSGGPFDFAARDTAVADASARFLDVVLDNRTVDTALTWGLSDRFIDPPQEWRLRLSGWRGRMLPLDAGMQRKAMWGAMARAFSGRRMTG